MNKPPEYQDESSLIAAAGFIDRLLDSGGFSAVIFRVKEHIRRGDNSIGPDEEEAVYGILGFCLKYFRLKTEFDGGSINWIPRLQPIMQALDKMSYNRAVSVIKLYMGTKKYASIGTVVRTYAEMLNYLFIFLCSSDSGHHEFAVALLFNLFFRSSDRLDPLPQLLRDWRPSTFDRNHANLLIELVHSTLKLLEKIKEVYFSPPSQVTKRSKKRDNVSEKSEVALEQYIAAVALFDVNEYFKRLVSHHVIRMFTRVLERYETNDPKINHYIYVFMTRLLNFKMDSNFLSNAGAVDDLHLESSLTMGHLLFNAHTLLVFSQILENTSFTNSRPYIHPLVDLIKSVVRRFFHLSSKNRLLFVEALIIHPFAVDFLQRIDTVYDAASFGPMSSAIVPPRRDESDEEDFEEGDLPDIRKQQRVDLGDEFDEADLTSAFSRKISEPHRAMDKPTEKRRRRPKKAKHAWSTAEDDLLRDCYKLYRGSRSIFETIALNPGLRAINSEITAKIVERRVRDLQLHVELADPGEIGDLPSSGPPEQLPVSALEVGQMHPNKAAADAIEGDAEKNRKSIAAVWENQSDDEEKWSGRRAFLTQRSKLIKRKTRDSDSEDDSLSVEENGNDVAGLKVAGFRLVDDD